MASDSDSELRDKIHEVELAKHGDHEAYDECIKVFVLAKTEKNANVKACDLQVERMPEWHTDDTTFLHCGWSLADSSENNVQMVEEFRDDVIVGPEVPV